MPAFERRLTAFSGIGKPKAGDESFASRSVVAEGDIMSLRVFLQQFRSISIILDFPEKLADARRCGNVGEMMS